MKTYYLTFLRTTYSLPEAFATKDEIHLDVQAPTILLASRMADLYVAGYTAGAGPASSIECTKVSLFPSRKPRT